MTEVMSALRDIVDIIQRKYERDKEGNKLTREQMIADADQDFMDLTLKTLLIAQVVLGSFERGADALERIADQAEAIARSLEARKK